MRRNTALSLMLILAFGTLASISHAQANGDVSDKSWIDWVGERAIHLDTLDWKTVELPGLEKSLEGKRIVYLGEPDHYIEEKYHFRLILIRHLFDLGYRRIGMEMGLSDGKEVDRYLETGDVKYLDRVAVHGYMGHKRSDRDFDIKGFPAMKNPEFRECLKNAEYWFMGQLRSINESLDEDQPRLRWYGYDVDVFPGKSYVDTEVQLAPHGSEVLVQKIMKRLALVENESVDDEVERLEELLAFMEQKKGELAVILGQPGAKELRRTVEGLKDSLLFFDVARKGPSAGNWIEGLEKREEVMYRQMDELLEDLPRGEKIILMGHNLHLSKDSESVFFGKRDNGRRKMWRSIGTHLAERLPGEVYSIWLLYDRGRHGNILLESAFEEVKSSPRRIEHLMAKAGPVFYLPFHSGDSREAYLDRDLNFVQNGSFASGYLMRQADAVFFVAEASVPSIQ